MKPNNPSSKDAFTTPDQSLFLNWYTKYGLLKCASLCDLRGWYFEK
jgi:hypothetical protein